MVHIILKSAAILDSQAVSIETLEVRRRENFAPQERDHHLRPHVSHAKGMVCLFPLHL
jgi:hypothetical protein